MRLQGAVRAITAEYRNARISSQTAEQTAPQQAAVQAQVQQPRVTLPLGNDLPSPVTHSETAVATAQQRQVGFRDHALLHAPSRNQEGDRPDPGHVTVNVNCGNQTMSEVGTGGNQSNMPMTQHGLPIGAIGLAPSPMAKAISRTPQQAILSRVKEATDIASEWKRPKGHKASSNLRPKAGKKGKRSQSAGTRASSARTSTNWSRAAKIFSQNRADYTGSNDGRLSKDDYEQTI